MFFGVQADALIAASFKLVRFAGVCFGDLSSLSQNR